MFVRQNIKYDDNINDSTEIEEKSANANIFDLFLSEANLDHDLVQ